MQKDHLYEESMENRGRKTSRKNVIQRSVKRDLRKMCKSRSIVCAELWQQDFICLVFCDTG